MIKSILSNSEITVWTVKKKVFCAHSQYYSFFRININSLPEPKQIHPKDFPIRYCTLE